MELGVLKKAALAAIGGVLLAGRAVRCSCQSPGSGTRARLRTVTDGQDEQESIKSE